MAEAKKPAEKFYSVEVDKLYPRNRDTYIRAGVTLDVKEPNVVALTDEQVKEIKNDKFISSVKSTKAPKREKGVGESHDKVSKELPQRDPKAVAKAQKQAEKASSETKKSEAKSKDTEVTPVEKLLSEKSRSELDEIAITLGIDEPAKYGTKGEVAELIVKAQAKQAKE